MTEQSWIAVGIFIVTVVVNLIISLWTNSKSQARMEGIVQHRLEAGEEKFKEIAQNCRDHSKAIQQLEVGQAHVCERIDNHDRRLADVETKR